MRETLPCADHRPGRNVPEQRESTHRRVTRSGRAGRRPQVLPALVAVLALLVGLVAPAAPARAATKITTAKPTIAGSARVGAVLTVRPGAWKPASVRLTFQWYRNGKAIPGAAATTYEVVARDKDKRLTVKVTGTLPGHGSASRVSKQTKKIAIGQLTAGVPRITGQAAVGSTLTASPGTWKPSNVTLKYQWYRSGTALKGATGTTYRPATADAGTTLRVRVTGSLAGYRSRSVNSAATARVTPVQPSIPVAATPTISGELAVGATVTGRPGTWSPGTTFRYQWLRNGTAIPNATDGRYQLTSGDDGRQISVRVEGVLAGYATTTRTSVASHRVLTAGTPQYGGDIAVGRTIEARPGSWSTGTTFSYQWLRDATPITGATSRTYRLTNADADAEIGLVVTGAKPGHATIRRTSPLHFRAMVVGTPTIAGAPRVGNTLTVNPGTWSAGTTTLVQWQRDGAAIARATSKTYVPSAADVGKRLSVEVIGYAAGYATIGSTSAPTAPVTGASISATDPTVTGDVRVGGRVTADPGVWGPAPVTLAYQWLIDGNAVGGATDQSWTIPVSAAGRSVAVRVTGSKPGYDAVSRVSAATRVRNVGVRLTPGMALRTDDYLLSGDGRFQLIMQGDGNLVLYQTSPRRALWASNTGGAGNWAVLQTDGNFVVYTASGAPRWATATDRKPVRDLVMQNDGNLVIYQTDGRAVWASNTVQVPPPPGGGGGVIGDDYPAYLKAAALDALVDPWNFYNRECTSFVAWRLNNANRVAFTNQYKGVARWGNAKEWGAVAQRVGIPVNNTPARGAVAWSSAGTYGHVAWVAAVHGDGTITIEEYNYNWDGKYHTRRVNASSFKYIHIKDI